MNTERVSNFSAGPSTLPESVLKRARDEMLSYAGAGMSIMEMSHRSKEFSGVLEQSEARVRKLMRVPDDYAVLFLQGGASHQFAMIPMNLAVEGKSIDLLQTGAWTQKASAEIEKISSLRLAATTEPDNFLRLPLPKEIDLNPDAAYVHMASNNTIFGTQWRTFPDPGSVPLVIDMSSDILSRPIDVSETGLIFAGAQKNLGPSGVTLVIMSKKLAERAPKELPTIFQYRTHIKAGSRYNTPPTYGIYMIGLVLEWLEEKGGVETIEKLNGKKSSLLYETIDSSGFYGCPVPPEDRSQMNVVFRIEPDRKELEATFVSDAEKEGLHGLKGHRSVGGLRASLYNAMELSSVQKLVHFMKEFEAKNG